MKHVLSLCLLVAAIPLAAQQPVKKPSAANGEGGRTAAYDYERSPYFRSKETFTVPRLADGSCDSRRIPTTPQPKGYTTMPGPFDVKTCTGVLYHMQFPLTRGGIDAGTLAVSKAETTTAVAPSAWSGPDTLTGRGRQARDVVNALLPRLALIDSVYALTFVNDSTALVDTRRWSGAGVTYTLNRKQGRWVVSDTTWVWISRSSLNTPPLVGVGAR